MPSSRPRHVYKQFSFPYRGKVTIFQSIRMSTAHAEMFAATDRPDAAEMALSMRGISHRFGETVAVDEVDLQVRAGEVVCLLGPSGCGKSTLLRIAAGLESLQQGEVQLAGETVARPGGRQLPPERRNLGLMFQDAALFPHLSVLENVTFGLTRLPAGERRTRALALLERLGLAAHATSYPHVLSGGQQQRVALARAVAPAPALMLLDEPFSALDTRLREQTRDDTLHLLKATGAGTLMVTHDPEEAMFMADRIALMREGRILQVGTPTELYCHPTDPFVVRFFGEVNEVEGVVTGGEVRTAFGVVPAPGYAEGTPVDVLIRPEAVNVRPVGDPGQHERTHVMMSRLLGRSSLLHLCVHTSDGQEIHGHSRMPGVFLPAESQPVILELDPSQVFLYSRPG